MHWKQQQKFQNQLLIDKAVAQGSKPDKSVHSWIDYKKEIKKPMTQCPT